MFTFTKIRISQGSGQRMARYMREPALAKRDQRVRVAVLCGLDAHGTWREDIVPAAAKEFGITRGRRPPCRSLAG